MQLYISGTLEAGSIEWSGALCCVFSGCDSPVLTPPSMGLRRQLLSSADSLLVAMGAATDSGEERPFRRILTDTTSVFSETKVMEGEWSGDSLFDSTVDFETASSPAAPPGDDSAAEQRAEGALKGFTLTFRDPYLEAGYQSARHLDLHRSTLVFRMIILVLLMLWLAFNFITVAVQRGNIRFEFILSFVPVIPTAVLFLCSFRRSFASRFDIIVASSSVAYIILQSLVDYRMVSWTRATCSASPAQGLGATDSPAGNGSRSLREDTSYIRTELAGDSGVDS